MTYTVVDGGANVDETESMRCAIFTPGRPPYWAEIPNELGTLQGLVGGCIECVGLGHGLVAIVDDEGLIKGKDYCLTANGIPLYGQVVICGVDGEEFCSVPDGVLNLG